MKQITLALFLALPWFLSPSPALGDHIPMNILTEIEREANEPACRYNNGINGTNYDCTVVDSDWVECWTTFLAEDLSYQGALDLLGQLKVSNTYYEVYYLPETNPYISSENMGILEDIDFVCWW